MVVDFFDHSNELGGAKENDDDMTMLTRCLWMLEVRTDSGARDEAVMMAGLTLRKLFCCYG